MPRWAMVCIPGHEASDQAWDIHPNYRNPWLRSRPAATNQYDNPFLVSSISMKASTLVWN
jgi:hypothetical protein